MLQLRVHKDVNQHNKRISQELLIDPVCIDLVNLSQSQKDAGYEAILKPGQVTLLRQHICEEPRRFPSLRRDMSLLLVVDLRLRTDMQSSEVSNVASFSAEAPVGHSVLFWTGRNLNKMKAPGKIKTNIFCWLRYTKQYYSAVHLNDFATSFSHGLIASSTYFQ